MSLPPEIRREVNELLGAMREGQIDAASLQRLDQLVSTDAEVRRLYLNYVNLCASLHWSYKKDEERETENDECGTRNDELTAQQAGIHHSPFIIHTSPPLFPALSPLPSFVASVLFSYLIAALIVGVGLLIASAWKLPDDAQFAKSSPAPTKVPFQPKPEVVGRITGMADCRWVDPDTAPSSFCAVPIGRKYALASGLLEIAYDAGARVILQGPVTYEVESVAGGFLSLGKLTARLQKEEGGNQKSEIRNQKSPFPPSPFVVRTPTAVVTDLGTEFGVTVSRDGLTQIHVLQGMVDARDVGSQGDNRRGQQVAAGRAVQIKPHCTQFETVAFAPQSFARKLHLPADNPADAAYINAVLADKPLGYWPLNEPAGARRFLDRSGNSFHGYAMNRVVAGQAGPLLGNSRAVTLEGKGYIDVGRHDEFGLTNDFTLEAWVCVGDIRAQHAARLISATPGSVVGSSGRMHGWSLEVSRQADQKGVLPPAILRFTTYGVKDYEIAIPNAMASGDQWVHVAVVCGRDNTAQFYLNGKHEKSVAADKPGTRGPVWIEIGGGTIFPEYWHGRLAHLAVYPQALSPQQIENHYNQGRTP